MTERWRVDVLWAVCLCQALCLRRLRRRVFLGLRGDRRCRLRSQEELELLDPRRRFEGLVEGVLVLRDLEFEKELELEELEMRVRRLFVRRVDLDFVRKGRTGGFGDACYS